LEISELRLRLRHLRSGSEETIPILKEIAELGHHAVPLVPDLIARMQDLAWYSIQLVPIIIKLKSAKLLEAVRGISGFLLWDQCKLLEAGFLQFQEGLVDELYRGFQNDGNVWTHSIADALAESGTSTALETMQVIEYRLAARVAELRAELNYGDFQEVSTKQMMRGEWLPVRTELLEKVRLAILRIKDRPDPLPVRQVNDELLVDPPPSPRESVTRLLARTEDATLEFKAALRWDPAKSAVDEKLEHRVLQTIAAFANGQGGTLLIGVDDARTVVGLQTDYDSLKGSRDQFERHLRNLIGARLDQATMALIVETSFHLVEGHEICRVDVAVSSRPLFLKDRGGEEFFVRNGNASTPLKGEAQARYIQERFKP
jgi:Putative DNA-binding domain